ncbi:hypothetical protein U1769_23870 [Sphingomonas sp. ZT3P38]|uniref:hypothetical protein n=1 Tax=Parasphingomonas zepuensis TaxID=3096161 RepID=UPI002FC5ED83
MNLSPSAIYELLFVSAIAMLAVIDAATVIPLRLLLKKWPSVWRKALLVHIAGMLVMLVLLRPISNVLLWLRYVGITPATLIGFSLLVAIGDGLREMQTQRLADPFANRRVNPWIILVAGGLLAAIVARASVAADEGKDAVEEAYWASLIIPSLQRQSPEREIIAALQRDFPEKGDEILRAYIQRHRDATQHDPARKALSPFPFTEIRHLIESKRADIARAPDAQLAEVAAHLAWLADDIAGLPKSCASAAIGGPTIVPEPGIDQLTSPRDRQRLGQMLAASLDAARAGIDHPVRRTFSNERLLALYAEFQQTLPPELAAVLKQPAHLTVATPQQRCAVFTAYLKWIARQPPEKAAYLLSQRASAP